MSKRRVLHTIGRCLGAAAVMAMSSAEGEIPKGTPVEVVGWFRRSSQFYLHLKCIACTIPVCVFGVTKRIFKQGPKLYLRMQASLIPQTIHPVDV